MIYWEQRKFGELFLEKRDKTEREDEDVLLSCAITGIYLNSELFSHFRGTSNIGYLKIKKNDLILSAQNLHLGNANVNLFFEHGIISPAYKVYELNKCDQYFVQSWVKKDSTKDFFLNATTEGASQCRKNIDWCILNNQLIAIPSLYEQIRIGKIFNCLNHLITLHQSKAFGHILEAIVSCILSWEQRKLGEIADKVVEKNFQLQERDVFTNSAEFGIIDQKDFFDHEIVNKNNIGGYYIVSPNDFVYNPRISVTAPVGPINRNKLCKRGIMSPLYTVFHPRNMNETFLEFFFKTNKWHKFMEYNGDSGARSDRFSIKTELFYVMTIPFPSHEEQSKVGICLESLDYLITLHQLEPFQLIFKAIAYRIIDYAKSKSLNSIKQIDLISYIKCYV